jgi:hypothetical protein
VDYFSGLFVEQDIVTVAIAKAEDVPENGDGGCGACVCEAALEPFVGVLEALEEEVAEDGVEVVGDLLPYLRAGGKRV